MKAFRVFVLTGLLLAAPLGALADETTKDAKIEEMFHLAKLDQMLQQSLEISANQVKSGLFQQLMGLQLTAEEQQSMQVVQNKLKKLLEEGLSWQTLKPAYIKLYSGIFSEDEIDGMLTFYKSPAGQAMLAKTPQLIAESNVMVQQRLVVLKPQFEALLKEVDGLKSK
jgi:uncharacterized protein